MTSRAARLPVVLLAIVSVGLTVAIPAVSPVRAATSVDAAEATMVAALNQDRTSRGLAAVQVDPRLMTIARARSTDMATRHYFDHTPPGGGPTYGQMIGDAGITWWLRGEIIAYNFDADLGASATHANTQWLNSSGHFAIITTAAYTHLGVGVAVDATNGRRLWTAVWVDEVAGSGPAPTPTPTPRPTATPAPTPAPTATPAPTPTPSPAPIAPADPAPRSQYTAEYWSRSLAPGTGGTVRYYQVQRRLGWGSAQWVDTYQTYRGVRIWWSNEGWNRMRVRMVDTRGRVGAWSVWVTYKP